MSSLSIWVHCLILSLLNPLSSPVSVVFNCDSRQAGTSASAGPSERPAKPNLRDLHLHCCRRHIEDDGEDNQYGPDEHDGAEG